MLFVVHRMKLMLAMVAALMLVALAVAEGEIWEEDDHEVLIRSERGAKNRGERLVQLDAFTLYAVKDKVNVARWRFVVSFMSPYPLDQKLNWPQSQFEYCLLSLQGNEPQPSTL